ncbi:hypothetical protein BJ875DRAFT_472071 [Amylocarpus encephaloides]|uniref:Uncharacterized protein n=1 Tax=Amylocarpus encephaloides TaxID=45428 RepID=A0A9P8C1N4_9HELO|nr:hypothetical protein BJ875DRAFT_472071 [Amylocarpus encephaloides]
MRCDLDGNNAEKIVRNGDMELEEPRADFLRWRRGISLNKAVRYVYWSQEGPPKGGKGMILRRPN